MKNTSLPGCAGTPPKGRILVSGYIYNSPFGESARRAREGKKIQARNKLRIIWNQNIVPDVPSLRIHRTILPPRLRRTPPPEGRIISYVPRAKFFIDKHKRLYYNYWD